MSISSAVASPLTLSCASVIGAASQLAMRVLRSPFASSSQSSANSAFHAGRDRCVP
jgi:hypothetical protein